MITAVKGTQDNLFPEIGRWQRVEAIAREVFHRYAFTEIRTPILEPTELFVRGIGGETDIVGKEMYTFPDRKGRSLTLRPENTAPVARAFVEHHLHDSPLYSRLYYIGPQFRYERPQKGPPEAVSPDRRGGPGRRCPGHRCGNHRDAQEFLGKAGVVGIEVVLNSVGCPNCRPVYVALLKDALAMRAGDLCGDCRRRLETKLLRVLDCKVPSCQPILDGAPAIADHLCEARCRRTTRASKRILREMGGTLGARPARAGIGLLHAHGFEVTKQRTRRAGRAPGRRPLRRPSGADRRARHARFRMGPGRGTPPHGDPAGTAGAAAMDLPGLDGRGGAHGHAPAWRGASEGRRPGGGPQNTPRAPSNRPSSARTR